MIKKGRFFGTAALKDIGEIYLHRFYPFYRAGGEDKGQADEISLGEDIQQGRKRIIYVNHSLKYKGFEIYRDKEGYSPLFVLRDMEGKVIYGAYTPLQSIKQEDGTFIYRSGSAFAPGSFHFPQSPDMPPVFRLQTTYYPDKEKKRAGDVFFQVWRSDPEQSNDGKDEIFKGKAAYGERVRVGDFFLSMEDVRYWASMNLNYHPGLAIIFSSFWIILAGAILAVIIKMGKGIKGNNYGK